MCTVVILRRPADDVSLVIGANRDEMRERPWKPPGRHWPDRPHVVGGLDELAGGTWMAVNDDGLVAALLNREHALGPAPGMRSRGELVLRALDHRTAADAAHTLARIDVDAFRPFNLVLADAADALWLAHRGDGRIEVAPIPAGLSMLTGRELNDATSPRIHRYRDRFRRATPPSLNGGDWADWRALLEETTPQPGHGPQSAMRFRLANGFETLSSTILVVPRQKRGRQPRWEFAMDENDVWTWRAVAL